MPFELDPVETRLLGCLLEKERLTPDSYPLSLHSLTAAANQSTNRDPVFTLEEGVVERGLERLREKGLVSQIHLAGSRVPKYRHRLPDHLEINPAERALITVLLLRGPQTPGELRSRSDRLHPFPDLAAVESCLKELARGSQPLVKELPPQPGQKERRFRQTLSAQSPQPEPATASSEPLSSLSCRIDRLERDVRALRDELDAVRSELANLRAAEGNSGGSAGLLERHLESR